MWGRVGHQGLDTPESCTSRDQAEASQAILSVIIYIRYFPQIRNWNTVHQYIYYELLKVEIINTNGPWFQKLLVKRPAKCCKFNADNYC